MAEDYYDTLGVEKGATRDQIKKAYKKLAKKYHPDNGETGDAEKFKKINEAAAVLSDDKKRQHYDQFGTADGNAGFNSSNFSDFTSNFGGDFGDIFDHLGDIFGGGFGGFGGGRGRRRGAQRGNDLRYDLDITLDEAAFGTEKKLQFSKLDKCSTCDGTGAESPDDVETCDQCKGQGQVIRQQRTPFGMFQTQGVCPKCRGQGKTVKKECKDCDGTGVERKKKNLDVKIPAGVENSMRLRVEGEGEAVKDGIPGDLYVFITVKPHKHFEREGDDILLDYPITVSQAALGTTIEVPTLKGKAKLKIPSGTQPETVFRLKEKGIEHLHHAGRGDQLVKVIVSIPKSLSKKEKKLFEDLDEEAKKSGFFKKLFGK